jgi:hypothetical protein
LKQQHRAALVDGRHVPRLDRQQPVECRQSVSELALLQQRAGGLDDPERMQRVRFAGIFPDGLALELRRFGKPAASMQRKGQLQVLRIVAIGHDGRVTMPCRATSHLAMRRTRPEVASIAAN